MKPELFWKLASVLQGAAKVPGSLDLPDMVKQPPARLPVPAGLAAAASGGLSGVAPAADPSGQGRRASVGAPAAAAAARQSLAGAEGPGTLSDRWGFETGHSHARASPASTHMRLAGLAVRVSPGLCFTAPMCLYLPSRCCGLCLAPSTSRFRLSQ